jgi:hypothetical protein
MSVLLDACARIQTASDGLPVAGIAAAADRLRVAIDLLTWVRTAAIRPGGLPQLSGALEHTEHAVYALLVARDELANYLRAIGVPAQAPQATAPRSGSPPSAAAAAPAAAGTAPGLPPLRQWWCERVNALTGCTGAYDEKGAARDSTELLRRVVGCADRSALRAELVRSSPPIGLGMAAVTPAALRNLATKVLGHAPRPDDLGRLVSTTSGAVRDRLPNLPGNTIRVLLGRVCGVPPDDQPSPHPADSAIAGAALVTALLRTVGHDLDRYLTEPVHA